MPRSPESYLADTSPSLTGGNITLVIVVAIVALAALGVAAYLVREVRSASEGTEKMKEIAAAVQEGATAYLARQFRTLSLFAGIAFLVLLALPADNWNERIGRSIFFLLGAGFSATTGTVGMQLAVRANVRVAAAARESGAQPGHPDRLPHRRRGRHVHRRPRPVRRRDRGARLPGRGPEGARGLRLRRRAAGHVHACRRRHLHQGRGRRRGPGRQGRAGHPGGRPAQRRDHRGQRRRQRRRLRRAWPPTCSSPTR